MYYNTVVRCEKRFAGGKCARFTNQRRSYKKKQPIVECVREQSIIHILVKRNKKVSLEHVQCSGSPGATYSEVYVLVMYLQRIHSIDELIFSCCKCIYQINFRF